VLVAFVVGVVVVESEKDGGATKKKIHKKHSQQLNPTLTVVAFCLYRGKKKIIYVFVFYMLISQIKKKKTKRNKSKYFIILYTQTSSIGVLQLGHSPVARNSSRGSVGRLAMSPRSVSVPPPSISSLLWHPSNRHDDGKHVLPWQTRKKENVTMGMASETKNLRPQTQIGGEHATAFFFPSRGAVIAPNIRVNQFPCYFEGEKLARLNDKRNSRKSVTARCVC
jgi:hypothetical protein